MIEFKNVSKRYQSRRGVGPWVLQDVSLMLPAKRNIGVIGTLGAGKTTFLNLIGGMDKPSRGVIIRNSTVSWLVGKGTGLQGSMTGRQNAIFVCRLFCHVDEHRERLAFIESFSELGDAFNGPVGSYSGGMRAKLQMALSLAFDFDIYISDGTTAAGLGEFRKKAAAKFIEKTNKGGLILASNGIATLKKHCESCIWLDDGGAKWYEKIDDALRDFKEVGNKMDTTVVNDE
ncbi:ABC transporter ATP-binding protein [Polaromonas sp. JS666]|uniref:ABC transporter ATP-binding protein n=1 Tax=Polaromonas sp. (strain JS666 / ATCC BAA-500) TaxID=296591 RepID=UPI00005321AC|nr:ATP-binding cassette domain-containing protein [Polaromonas sp. JS666]ABE46814.1 ATPase component ABC-type polysaccharide/polyol phosphate transport system [Polaromonas sp. JS666]